LLLLINLLLKKLGWKVERGSSRFLRHTPLRKSFGPSQSDRRGTRDLAW